MSELMDEVRALHRRQQAALNRVATLRGTYMLGHAQMITSLDAIASCSDTNEHAVSRDAIESAVRARAQNLLEQIDRLRAMMTESRVSSSGVETTALDIAVAAEDIQAMAQRLPEHVPDVIYAQIIAPAIDKLQESWQTLEDDWNTLAEDFEEETGAWKGRMETLRDTFTETLQALNEDTISASWEQARVSLSDAATEQLQAVRARAEQLYNRVLELIAGLKEIVEAIVGSRQLAQQTTSSVASGLELVTGILNDVKSVLAAVR